MRVVSFLLYIHDIQRRDVWARYVAGMIQCIYVCGDIMPDFQIAAYVADDTLRLLEEHGYDEWHKLLSKALNQKHVTMHPWTKLSIPKDIKRRFMAQTVVRLNVLRDYSDAEIVALRDVDSPPTQLDVDTIQEWARTCMTTNPILSYQLPVWGCNTCAGGITVYRPGETCELVHLPEGNQVSKMLKEKGTGRGIDESFLQLVLPLEGRCAVDCYHHPHTYQYFISTDFIEPLIDRIDDEQGISHFLDLARGPCPASTDARSVPNSVWGGERIIYHMPRRSEYRDTSYVSAPVRWLSKKDLMSAYQDTTQWAERSATD